jgi:hypothetical protein
VAIDGAGRQTLICPLIEQLGIAREVGQRSRIFPNGATAMRHLADSDARPPIGCTQSTEIRVNVLTPSLILNTLTDDRVTACGFSARLFEKVTKPPISAFQIRMTWLRWLRFKQRL